MNLEARAGIEPAVKALQALALPLCYLAIKNGRRNLGRDLKITSWGLGLQKTRFIIRVFLLFLSLTNPWRSKINRV